MTHNGLAGGTGAFCGCSSGGGSMFAISKSICTPSTTWNFEAAPTWTLSNAILMTFGDVRQAGGGFRNCICILQCCQQAQEAAGNLRIYYQAIQSIIINHRQQDRFQHTLPSFITAHKKTPEGAIALTACFRSIEGMRGTDMMANNIPYLFTAGNRGSNEQRTTDSSSTRREW